ncbi:uncharacterized protein LOC130625799 [Hydractinia symbiolongicarpus]|uniref:uncharacterized protein LOC130625799 n=1 Tax=Hydractinia symbiolongicarpus TaxID=13093 RepID=UPI00254E1E14|nr:uncharacterized protein LOC130625799 [Hydractinia symbiolongicarpus]
MAASLREKEFNVDIFTILNHQNEHDGNNKKEDMDAGVNAKEMYKLKFEDVWNHIRCTVAPVLSGKSQRKRKVLKKVKEGIQKKVEKMFETDVDGSETIKHIESDLYERFQVRLELIKYMKGQEGSESVVSGCYPLPERNKLDGQDECDADSQETKSSETDELSNDVPLRKKKKWSYMPTKQDELVEKLDGANKRLTRLENLTSTLSYRIHELKEKNASLLLRNAEFTRLKLVEQLGMNRSVQMVDASLFASRFHTGDPLLQEETPCILDSAFISTLKITDFCEGVFASTKRAMFDDGDTVILKTFSKDCCQNNIKNVAM